jgi:hypothetical protein
MITKFNTASTGSGQSTSSSSDYTLLWVALAGLAAWGLYKYYQSQKEKENVAPSQS